MVHLLAALLPSVSLAAAPLAWERQDFGQDAPVAGSDGWTNGYEADPWWGVDGVAATATDHNVGDDPDAWRNWLVRGPDLQQIEADAWLYNEDDDAIGLVFGHDGSNTWYLAAHTANSAPPPIESLDPSADAPIVFLLRVQDGVATELGRAEAALDANEYTKLSVRVDDGRIRVLVHDVLAIDVADALLPAGQVGFWAYDTGHEGGGGSTDAWFDRIEVRSIDEDDDGVIDDADNCEAAANPTQADADADGIGDACDPSDPGGPDDTANPDDTGDPSDDGGITGARCGCDASGAGALPPLLVLAVPWVRRRRR